jgi:hypothetical protein
VELPSVHGIHELDPAASVDHKDDAKGRSTHQENRGGDHVCGCGGIAADDPAGNACNAGDKPRPIVVLGGTK